MTCPKCKGENCTVQMVTDTKTVKKTHGLLYNIFIGWWLFAIKWIFLTIPALIFKIFGVGGKKVVTEQHKYGVCQSCGHNWEIK